MAVFKVFDTIYIASIDQFIVVGDIISGSVSKGMKFNIGNDSVIIQSIEEIDGKLGGRWVSRLGLKIKGDHRDFGTNLKETLIEGVEIEIN